MRAELRDNLFLQGHAHVVDTGSCRTHDFRRRRDQAVAEIGGPQERNTAMRRDCSFIVSITGKRKRRVRKRENCSAVGDAEAIDHGRQHRHRNRDLPSLDR